eukprot:11758380-Alexandrium_andersonii.AAC.1
MSIPPCQRQAPGLKMLQTYALKIADAPPRALSTFGQGRLVLGAGAYAVTVVSVGKDAGSYL